VVLHRKIPRDLTEASLSGAGLSIIAALAMVFLFGMVNRFSYHHSFCWLDVSRRYFYFESKFKVRLSQGAGLFKVIVRVELQADLCIGLVFSLYTEDYGLSPTHCLAWNVELHRS
jgi:hypothetical protein